MEARLVGCRDFTATRYTGVDSCVLLIFVVGDGPNIVIARAVPPPNRSFPNIHHQRPCNTIMYDVDLLYLDISRA